jgi:hypothetical protein
MWVLWVQVYGQHTDSHIACTSGVMVVASVALGWGSIYASQRRWAIVRLRYRTHRGEIAHGVNLPRYGHP